MKAGVYKHYKGGQYLVMGICRHTETLEELVAYRALSLDSEGWVRPRAMFEDSVEYNGKIVKRFELLKEM